MTNYELNKIKKCIGKNPIHFFHIFSIILIKYTVRLSEIKDGGKCIVTKLLLSEKDNKRLEEMGLTEGVRIEVLRRAPLKSPVQIFLRNFSMALRLSDADRISVNKI